MAFKIVRDDITRVSADAIVNTANPDVAVGDGVDFAIYEAAGRDALLAARSKIGVLEPGEVGITPAFKLDAEYIIHSSGPVWRNGSHGEAEVLRQCYDKALHLAAEKGCRSIAFPLMATGTYGFPQKLGMQIAVDAFKDFLEEYEMEIVLVVFGSYAYKISGQLFEEVQSYIDDCYVEKAYQSEYLNDGVPLRQMKEFSTEQEMFDSVCDEAEISINKEAAEWNVPEYELTELSSKRLFSGNKASKKAMSLDECLRNMYTDSFEKHLQQIINRKGMKNSEVYAAANISKQYFSKLMKGQVKPSKEKVLSLAIGLKLNLDETVDFLKIAGYALSPISQTDVIVEYFIQQKDYSVMKIDIVLFDYGLPPLSE